MLAHPYTPNTVLYKQKSVRLAEEKNWLLTSAVIDSESTTIMTTKAKGENVLIQ